MINIKYKQSITEKDLFKLVKHLNQITNNPVDYCTRVSFSEYRPNPGNYYIDMCYGGYRLDQVPGKVIIDGYNPKRVLYYKIQSFINGLSSGQ